MWATRLGSARCLFALCSLQLIDFIFNDNGHPKWFAEAQTNDAMLPPAACTDSLSFTSSTTLAGCTATPAPFSTVDEEMKNACRVTCNSCDSLPLPEDIGAEDPEGFDGQLLLQARANSIVIGSMQDVTI